MPQLYIHYIAHDYLEGGETYYGPFDPVEIGDRVNDEFAYHLSLTGDVLVASIGRIRAGQMQIESRQFWMDQLASLEA
jgi:hypothetical protein